MANYYVSDAAYGRTYDRIDPSTYGRSYERADPSTYGRGYDGINNSLGYGGSEGMYGSIGTNGGNWRRQQSISPAYDRRGFDEHVTKVAMEYIQPSRTTSISSVPNSYLQGPNSNGYKSSIGYPARVENYDGFPRKEYSSGIPTYPSSTTLGPSHGRWNNSSGHSGQLTNPTNNIGTAIRYIDEAARTVAPGSQLAETTTKIHTYVEKAEIAIDPAKRYGSYSMFGRRSTSG